MKILFSVTLQRPNWIERSAASRVQRKVTEKVVMILKKHSLKMKTLLMLKWSIKSSQLIFSKLSRELKKPLRSRQPNISIARISPDEGGCSKFPNKIEITKHLSCSFRIMDKDSQFGCLEDGEKSNSQKAMSTQIVAISRGFFSLFY